ncbi:MAG: SRPBCC family protein [Phycisphaerae bacterium]|jgi:uncharacterized protein YndB with AHSA1/START domain
MFWLYLIVAVVAVLVIAVAAMRSLGARLPEEHVATVSLRLPQAPNAVWKVISDAAGHVEWAAGVTNVVRLEDRDGKPAWRQHMGRNSFVLVTTESVPPARLVRTIDDDHKMFSGSWTYELSAEDDGTLVRLTERGRIPSPFARFVMHKFMDPAMYARKHLVSLAKKFGEPAERVQG